MKVYLLRLTTIFAGVMLLVAGFCYLVDPYAVFGVLRIEGLSLRKPHAHDRALEAKIALFKRRSGDVLLLGDSRIDIAFDPETLSDETPPSIFNMGIPGAGISNVRKNYLTVSAIRPQNTVVVGLDFVDFLVSDRAFEPQQASSAKKSSVRILIEQTLSIAALKHSIATIWVQRSRWANNMTVFGYNDRRGYERTVLSEGHFALFEDKNRAYSKRLNKLRTTIFNESGKGSKQISELSSMIEDMAVGSKHIWIFNYPYHQQMHSLLEARGLDTIYSQWLVEIDALVDAKQKKFADVDIRFLTIPAYNKMTTEKVPLKGIRKTGLNYYWESVHFKTLVGAEIYRLLLNDQCWEDGVSARDNCSSPLRSETGRTEFVSAGVSLEHGIEISH